MKALGLFNALLATAAFVVLCSGAYAQTRPSPGPPPFRPGEPGQLPGQNHNPNQPPGELPPESPLPNMKKSEMHDRIFIRQAIDDNLGEIDLAKLAMEKTSNANVRLFAERMIADHNKMNNQMEAIAHHLQVEVPTQPGGNARKIHKKLKALTGPQFDRGYADEMIKLHKDVLIAYQRQLASTQNPQLRDAVAQGAQIIQQHLLMARNLQKAQRSA